MTTKTYTRRDSATSVLRKMGINSRDYNLFISKNDDGSVTLDLSAAESHVSPVVEDDKPAAKKKKPSKKTSSKKTSKKAEAKEPVTDRVTISGMCRSMILDGSSNEDILEALRTEFGEERFGPEKNHYPTWYRCELRRKGELPPAFDNNVVGKDDGSIHKFED